MKKPNAAPWAATAGYCPIERHDTTPASPTAVTAFDQAAEYLRALDPSEREKVVAYCQTAARTAPNTRPHVARVQAFIGDAIDPATGFSGAFSRDELAQRAKLSAASIERALYRLTILGLILTERAPHQSGDAWRFTLQPPSLNRLSDSKSVTNAASPLPAAQSITAEHAGEGATTVPLMARQIRLNGRPSIALSESAIQRTVVQHLQWRSAADVTWFAVPNGGARSKAEASILTGHGVVSGVPDLILTDRSQLFGLELKTENGRLSEVQRAFQERLRASGAIVKTTYGLDDALDTLERWRLLRTAGCRVPP